MIEIKAAVVDKTPGVIRVKTSQGCASCQSGCGLGEISGYLNRRNASVAIACNETAVTPGDEVTLAISESALLWAGFFVYLAPAAFMALGAAMLALGGDNAAIIGAFGGLLLGFALMHLAGRRHFSPPAPRLVQTPSSNFKESNHD